MNTPLESTLRAFRRACLITGAAIAATTTASAATKAIDDGAVNEAYSYDFAAVRDWSPGTVPVGLVYADDGDELPPGLSINSSSGLISGVPTTEGDFTATLTYKYDGIAEDLDVTLTIDPQAGTPEITSAATSTGTVGIAYSFTLTASNTPTAFNVDSAELPNGLAANSSTGEISGTPTEAGTFPLTVSANNAVATGGAFMHTITIDPAGDLSEISSTATRTVDVNVLFSYQIDANNTPLEYEANNLPLGLTMTDTSTGLISGTPTVEGTNIVAIRVLNEFGWTNVFNLTITVGAVPQISSVLTLSLTESTAMDDYTVTASNTPTTYSVTGLPSGLSFDSTTKMISGTPASSGTSNISIYAINGVGQGPTATLVITVEPGFTLQPYVNYREATYSTGSVGEKKYIYIHFDQSAEDLAAFDYVIETSSDLVTWTSTPLEDLGERAEIIDNGDGTKSVKVRYPDSFDTSLPQYMRYEVSAKP